MKAGEEYFLKISGAAPARYQINASVGTARKAALDFSATELENLSSNVLILRRDVILGGAGNDVLSGGSGEEWIFGGTGNDVLAGGADRQASDLLFGQDGDDIFQVIPDRLPLIKGTARTLIPTLSDRFDGGAGNDEVLFLGHLDRLGRPVNDHVAIRFNTQLHRYEISTLVWDITTQQFVRDSVSGLYEQEFAFYQVLNTEKTVIDTRSGDDEVHDLA